MMVSLRPLLEIKPYEKNPRINDAAVEKVAESIRQFGFRQPIVVDVKGVIVCGHTRWKAAQKLGLKEVPVHVARDLTQKQIRAYRIADNKTAELAEWNFDLLSLELSDLQNDGIDLSLLGFDADELLKILNPALIQGKTDPDAVPEPPDDPITRPGNLWILGEHRLLCADAGSAADVDRLLGGAKIHLANADPPYNVKVEPRSNNAIAAGLSSFSGAHHQRFDQARRPGKAKASHRKLRPKDRPLVNDFVSEERFEQMLRAWFGNIARVLEPGRSFYLWGGYANCANYPPALKACGLYFSQAIIWVKEHPVLTRKDFMGNHEWCFYGWREGGAHVFFGRSNIQDVWEIKRAGLAEYQLGRGLTLVAGDGARIAIMPPANACDELRMTDEGVCIQAGGDTDVWRVKKISPQSMVHLTEKPVELAIRAMHYSSRPGENVLDLFGGSGSTLIAAEQAGRRAFLMEVDPLYADVIVRRWEEFTGRKAKREKTRR